ncbi:MAG: hypothetical protein QM776_01690 [Rhodocyclaceae bacterium]
MLEFISRLFSLSLLVVLTACGGGGGGGGAGGGGSASSVSVDKTSIALSYVEGSTSGSSTSFVLTINNAPSGLPVGAVATGSGIANGENLPFTVISSNQLRFSVSARLGLASGTYTGEISIYVCADLYCQSNLPGVPIKINYVVTVTPGFSVTPSAVAINAVSGVGGSAKLEVNGALPPGTDSITVSVNSGSNWLSVGGQTSSSVSLVAKPWRSGTYSGSVRLTAGTKSVLVPVSYVVTAPAGSESDLLVTPSSLLLTAVEGGKASSKSLAITLPTWGSSSDVSISTQYLDAAGGWLTVSRTPTGALVKASPTMTEGNYFAVITISPDEPGFGVQIPVTFVVGGGLMTPDPVVINLNEAVVSGALSGTVSVTSRNGVVMNWAASSDQPWLKLPVASGSTGASLSYQVEPDRYR